MWISIQDQMPPHGLPVLCCYVYRPATPRCVRLMEVCYWSAGTHSWYTQWEGPTEADITHWMYLPELPNG